MLWLGAVEAISARLGSGATLPASSRHSSSGRSSAPPAQRRALVGAVDDLAEQGEEDRPQQLRRLGVADQVQRGRVVEQRGRR